MSCHVNLIKTLESLGATTAQRMLVLLELHERGPIATNDFQSAATGFTREMLMVFEAEETVESALITGKRKDGRIWRLTDKAFSAIAGAFEMAESKYATDQDPQVEESYQQDDFDLLPPFSLDVQYNWLMAHGMEAVEGDQVVTIYSKVFPQEPLVRVAYGCAEPSRLIAKACQEVAQICGIAPPI